MATWTGRTGAYPSPRSGDVIAERDARGAWDGALHALRALADATLGVGRGVWVDGAVPTSGNSVPAGAVIVWCDGYPVARRWTASQPITFEAASGALALYAVVPARTDADAAGQPAVVSGDGADIKMVARLAADPAPAWSLLLGSGTAAASSFASFTAAAGVRRLLTEHAASHAAGGADALTPAAIGAVTTSDLRLSDARTPLAHAASHASGGTDPVTPAQIGALPVSGGTMTGLLTASGGLARASATLFGPPASGAAVVGQRHTDAAGAEWLCTAAGTPGVWLQVTAGVATVWSGGGAQDITLAANWAGGAIIAGYRVYEPSYGAEWVRDGGLARWLGLRRWVQAPGAAAALSTTTILGNVVLPTASDLWLESLNLCWTAGAGTWGASDKWTLELRAATAGLSGYVLHGPHSVAAAGSDCATVGLSALLATGTYPIARLICTKTGAPGTLLAGAAALTAREARR